MISFKEYYLEEGGNVVIDGIPAERMDLMKIPRKEAVATIRKGLGAFNDAFMKFSGLPLWNESLFNSTDFLSGSTKAFFDLSGIPTELFVSKKSKIGDIDLMVPEAMSSIIKDFLSTIKKGTSFGTMTWVGFKPSGDQYITLWRTDFGLALQVDLELSEFDSNGKPTAWATFSHSSAWEDMKKGIKGVFSKYLFRSITAKASREVIVLKGKKQNPKKAVMSDYVASLKGIRQRIQPVIDETTGKQRYIDGLAVFTELPSAGAKYFNDMETFFALLFNGVKPQGTDLQNINSFVGMIELIKKYLNAAEQKKVVDRFAEILFGKGAQGMYRGREGRMRDFREKTTALRYICKELDISWQQYIPMIKTYYRSYK